MKIDGNDIQNAKDEALDHMRSYGDDKLYLDEVENVLDRLIYELVKRAQ